MEVEKECVRESDHMSVESATVESGRLASRLLRHLARAWKVRVSHAKASTKANEITTEGSASMCTSS